MGLLGGLVTGERRVWRGVGKVGVHFAAGGLLCLVYKRAELLGGLVDWSSKQASDVAPSCKKHRERERER